MARVAPQLVRYRHEFATAHGLALESIGAHKLRSFLTLLGVIIGVASVILVGAAIEGLGVYAEESTAKVFGSETYLVSQVASAGTATEFYEKLRRNKPIRQDDFQYLQATTGDRIIYSPYKQRSEEMRNGSVLFENGVVLGVSYALPEIRDVSLSEGRFFTEQEERTKQFVIVIGEEVRAALFPGTSAVGRTMKLGIVDFRVVGVQEKLGSAFGRTQDNAVYIPYPVFNRLYGTRDSLAIFGRARAGTGLRIMDALDITRVALRTRFRARPGGPDNFDSLTPDALQVLIQNILSLISAVVVPVTCISLVVGGIVIMNIMLVSVTERTREIGVRKSLGARRGDIQMQFLIEAVMLAAAGGAAGVVLGAAATEGLSRLFEIRMRVTGSYVALGLAVSSVVGIVSGWYPAWRAARLDPVEALRAE